MGTLMSLKLKLKVAFLQIRYEYILYLNLKNVIISNQDTTNVERKHIFRMQFQKPLYFREFLLVTGNSYHYNSTKEMNHSTASYVAI